MTKSMQAAGCFLCVITALSLAGCGASSEFKEHKIALGRSYNELITEQEFNQRGHQSVDPKYWSPISMGYDNADGTSTVYFYAAPIAYETQDQQLSLIDTRLVNVADEDLRDQGYVYTVANSNLQPYYPKSLNGSQGVLLKGDSSYSFGIGSDMDIHPVYTERKNFIGDKKSMLKYSNIADSTDMYLYPSDLGSNCEINFKKKPKKNSLAFWIRVPEGAIVEKTPGGYITISENGVDSDGKATTDLTGVIQAPLLRSKSGGVSYSNSVGLEKISGTSYKLGFVFDSGSLTDDSTAFISFELREEKQPDNCLYSGEPDLTDAYLKNYSVVGNSPDYGLGRLLIRYDFAKESQLTSGRIRQAYYTAYDLSRPKEYPELEMVSVLQDWCSMTDNWNSDIKTGGQICSLKPAGPQLRFDITDEFKKWCDDPDANGPLGHQGVQLKSVNEEKNTYDLLLSNDNSLYRNYTEVILEPSEG